MFRRYCERLQPNRLEKVVLGHFYHKGMKPDGAKTQWSQMKGKKTLIVMDDADSVCQLSILPQWQHFGDGSSLIITSLNKGVFKVFQNYIIYELDFLDTNEATKLFCKHAFGSDQIPPGKSEQLRDNVISVVEKSGGLPLSLQVMGRYLRDVTSNTVWEETLDNLRKAVPIDGGRNGDDRLWGTLEVSYNQLSDEAQEMFCEAATFFFGEQLERAFAVWNGRKAETTWKNLVDRAMVKEVTVITSRQPEDQFKVVWVHQQLRDLAVKVAKETMLHSETGEVVGASTR